MDFFYHRKLSGRKSNVLSNLPSLHLYFLFSISPMLISQSAISRYTVHDVQLYRSSSSVEIGFFLSTKKWKILFKILYSMSSSNSTSIISLLFWQQLFLFPVEKIPGKFLLPSRINFGQKEQSWTQYTWQQERLCKVFWSLMNCTCSLTYCHLKCK